MKNIMIAPVGEDIDALFIGIKEFSTEKVILITPEGMEEEAEKAQEDLKRFKVPAEIRKIKGNIWESMFEAVGDIKAHQPEDRELIINVATGDKMSSCVAVSAAFVNGLKAMGVRGDDAMLLPVLKFSYYKALTDKKMKILETIHNEKDCCSSLDQLSKKLGMSLPLISYHVNGNLKSDGLKDLGLVETVDSGGRTSITLSTLGRLLIRGYV